LNYKNGEFEMAVRSESRKKTQMIQVRATPEEKVKLKTRAADFGISMGELCRQTLFGVVVKSKTDQNATNELAETRADLGRLGGLLKGWLSGSFLQASPQSQTHSDVVILLRQIEAAQKEVLAAVKKLMDKP